MKLLSALLLLNLAISPHHAHMNGTLVRAAALGDTQKAADQIREGADVNTQSILGQTPLELAVEYHHFETARLLLEHGAKVNCGSSFGTPLIWAAVDGDVAITKLLLDGGAQVDSGRYSLTPLTAALLYAVGAKAQPDMLGGLVVEISPGTPHNRRLAHLIKEKEEEQEMRQYVGSQGALVSKRRAQGIQVVKLLLSHGADIDKRGGAGSTPLMNAALVGSTEAARLLINHGANVKTKDDEGHTALWYASLSEVTTLVEFLISKGADINVQGKDGDTPLFNAVHGQNLEIVQFLLEHG